MRVLVLIVDYQSHKDAYRVAATLAHPRSSHLVAIIDNGSLPALEKVPEGVRKIRLNENRGYAGGINEGLRALGDEVKAFDLIWILNPDLTLDLKTLETLAQKFKTEPRLGAAGPRVLTPEGKVWGARGWVNPWLGLTGMEDWTDPAPLPPHSYIPGCSLMVRRQAFSELGGLPDRYRLYYEETEFCLQLRNRGWQLRVVPEISVVHHVDSMKGRIPAAHYVFYFIRNNLYFWKNNFGIPAWVQFPRLLFVSVKEILIPLRRASDFKIVLSRIRLLAAALKDSFSFLQQRYTPNERIFFSIPDDQMIPIKERV